MNQEQFDSREAQRILSGAIVHFKFTSAANVLEEISKTYGRDVVLSYVLGLNCPTAKEIEIESKQFVERAAEIASQLIDEKAIEESDDENAIPGKIQRILSRMSRCDDSAEALATLKSVTTKTGSKRKLSSLEASQLWRVYSGEDLPFWEFATVRPPKKRKASAVKVKTEEESKHLEDVASLGCVVCRLFLGRKNVPAQVHHIREGVGMGQRASHMDVIPLCSISHSGVGHHMYGGRGVGYHDGRESFVENFGTEFELLDKVRELLDKKKKLGYLP